MNELEKIFFNQLHVIINIMNNIIFPLFITFNAIIFYLYFLWKDINNSNILYKILRKRKKKYGHLRGNSVYEWIVFGDPFINWQNIS